MRNTSATPTNRPAELMKPIALVFVPLLSVVTVVAQDERKQLDALRERGVEGPIRRRAEGHASDRARGRLGG